MVGGTTGQREALRKDMVAGTVTVISDALGGADLNDTTTSAVLLSGDGQSAVYSAGASNLVNNDTNAFDDVFRWTDGTNTLVTLADDGGASDEHSANYGSGIAATSTLRHIVFGARATNLAAAADPNGTPRDVDVAAGGDITRINALGDGTALNGGVYQQFSISEDGNLVAWIADKYGAVTDCSFTRVWLKNLTTGELDCVDKPLNGADSGSSDSASLSGDGRYRAYTSQTANMTEACPAATRSAIVQDVATGGRACVTRYGARVTGATSVRLSRDGQWVVFAAEGGASSSTGALVYGATGNQIFRTRNPLYTP